MFDNKNNIIYINNYLEDMDTIWVDLNYPITEKFYKDKNINLVETNTKNDKKR